jgi:hypothetical protein
LTNEKASAKIEVTTEESGVQLGEIDRLWDIKPEFLDV